MYNNIQDTLISSRLNDPTDRYRCFNVNIMMLYIEIVIFEHSCYISALGHVRMLTLSSYVLLACINAIYYGHAWGI